MEAIKKTINGMTDVVDLESEAGDDHLDVDVDAESNGTGPESSVGKARAVLRVRLRFGCVACRSIGVDRAGLLAFRHEFETSCT